MQHVLMIVIMFVSPALVATFLLERYDQKKEQEYEQASARINETLSAWHPEQD